MTPEKCPFDEALEAFDSGARGTSIAAEGMPTQHYSFTREQMRKIRTALIAARDEGKDKGEKMKVVQTFGNCRSIKVTLDHRDATQEQQAEAATIEKMHTGDMT